jgi:hypothetical protein
MRAEGARGKRPRFTCYTSLAEGGEGLRVTFWHALFGVYVANDARAFSSCTVSVVEGIVGGVEVPLSSHLRFDDSDGRRRTRGGRAQTQPELKASHRNALALGTQTFDTRS